MSEKMHVVQFTGVEQAELFERERNTQPPGEKEVVGHTIRSLISPGTELAGYRGQYAWAQFPISTGYAAVFEVDAVGSGVTDLKPGDLAFCMGNHQSHQRAPREHVAALPVGLSPEIAPFARLMCVTMSTLTTTVARPPAKVIVTGLGIVGHLAARMFQSCGYDVLAVDPSEARRDAALRGGVKRAAPAIPLNDPEYAGKVALVVECSGHEQAALDACKVVQKRGEVVIVAAMWQQRTTLSAFEMLNTIFNRYVTVRSGWEWELPLTPTDFRANSIYGNIVGAMQWLADGRITTDQLALTRSPREAQAAYQQLLHDPAKSLSVLFDWTSV